MKVKTTLFITIFWALSWGLAGQIKNLEDLKKNFPDVKVYNEQAINRLGYRLIQSGQIGKALEVFKFNARLYPDSWNVYDSLGEMMMITGEREQAIKNYQKSLQLNPKNIHGQHMLEKIYHPELAPFTGDFEFYQSYRYHRITFYIEKGKLTSQERRKIPLTWDGVDMAERTFTHQASGVSSRLTFAKDSNGSINQGEWFQGKKILLIKRVKANLLKKQYSKEDLRTDFNQFRHLVETKMVKPYQFISKKEFDRLFDEHLQAIKAAMPILEFYNLLVPLKAKIGCGHCHLDYPGEYRNKVQRFKFPLILTFINNHCYVVKNLHKNHLIPLYSEITSINNIRIGQIIQDLKTDISADGYNDSGKTAALANCFQYYYANHYGVPKSYQIEYLIEDKSESKIISIAAIPCQGIHYSNKKSPGLLFKIMPQHHTTIMTVGSFIYYGKKNKIFFDYVDRAFEQIKEKNIGNLIIDLRGNGGGDPFCASYLLSYLEKKPTVYFAKSYGKYARLAKPIAVAKNNFTGKTYVLIDGSIFSTSGHFCSLLKYHDLCTFVGTETGSTYTCNAAVQSYHLKNTRILVKLSTGSFAAAVTGFNPRHGIIPDHKVEPSIEDLKKGRDSIIDYTLNLIKGKKI